MIGSASEPLDRDWAQAVLERARTTGVVHRESADVEREMRGWDAFVLPSRRDPFPLVMLEAMGLGMPVIGTDVDGIAEQIAPGTGLLTSSEDAPELAQAVERLVALPQSVRAGMGAAARQRVIEHFSLGRLVEGTERLYHDVLAR